MARRAYETKGQRRRRTVISEWTGLEPPAELAKFERTIDQVLKTILSKVGVTERKDHDLIAAEWPQIVGEHLARHSRPVALRRGFLQIAVLHAPVRYDLERHHKQTIITKLNDLLGAQTVKGIRFTGG